MTTQTPDSKPRALIAMSGGVDSSVAAWLMQQAGYDCTGITMRLTRNETLGQSGFHTCCSEKDIEDAAEVAYAMDIPYEVLDFTADFREQIIEKFVRVYEAGGTPNPCIDCNKYMKFRHLLDWARAHGMEYVVTGHYARVEQDEATGRFLLKKGLDEGKDQSYVLYNLTQEQLAHIRLPLGGLHKTEVREIAEQHKFVNARKHDSQDICFVPDGDYARFMEDFTGKRYPAGDFLDENGRVVGTHNGAVRYTIGQRKGLGLAMGAPVYVCGKDMQANTVTVGPEEMLFDRIVYADEVNWIAIPELTGPLRVTARTRYHQVEQAATVYPAECGFRLEFDQPQRAPTPGQAVVLYQGDTVLGGGTITRVEKSKENEMQNQYSRTQLLLGAEAMEKLHNSRVAVFGIGGVGGYTVEALARSGVGALDLIDDDKVCLTNLNRQIIATRSTVGQYKVDVAAQRIHDIDPDIKVTTHRCFFGPETQDQFDFTQYDYVVDAIDTVTGKLALVMKCKEAGTPIICSMGAGNKMDPTRFEVTDIYKPSVCPLAKVMRTECRKRRIKHLKVVYSKEPAMTPIEDDAISCKDHCICPPGTQRKCTQRRSVPGSNAFVPSVAGLIIGGEVVKDLVGFVPMKG